MNLYDCPIDCPNRHIACQNVRTCKIYASKIKRNKDMKVYMYKPDKCVPRYASVIKANGSAR
jgi:hypothetical protein